MMGLLKNLCAASFNACCAAVLSVPGASSISMYLPDVDGGDALVTHLLERIPDGLALRIHHGLLWSNDNFRFHLRAPKSWSGRGIL